MSDFTNNLALPVLLDAQSGAEILIDQAYAIIDNIGINATYLSVDMTSISTLNLTVADQTAGTPGTISTGMLILTGTPGAGITIQFPLQVGSSTLYVARNGLVVNNTTAQTATIQAHSGGATVSVAAGTVTSIACDGTNVYSLSGGGNTLLDSTWQLENSSDHTKIFKFDASAIPTGTTVNYTVPSTSTTLIGRDTTDTLTNKHFSTAAGNTLQIAATTISGVSGGGNNVVLDTSPNIITATLLNTSIFSWGSATTSSWLITATGSTQGTATALNDNINFINSGIVNTGVRLTTSGSAGTCTRVYNSTTTAKKVYPPTGYTIIDGLTNPGTNNAITLQSGGSMLFIEAPGPNSFYVLDNGSFTATGTSTLTNKTFDTAGTGNSFLIAGVAVTANSGTGAVARAVSPAFTTPALGAATGASVVLTGSVTSLHLIGNSSAPTIVAGTGAGTGPTVSISGTDTAMQVTVTTGTTPAGSNATIATITYSTAFPGTPHPVWSDANGNAALLNGTSMVSMDGASTTTFTIVSGTVGLTAATPYKWNVLSVG